MQIAYSQPSGTSKIAIPEKDALKVLAKGYEAKAFEAQRDLLLTQVDTLKARISIKEMVILNLNGQIADLKSMVSSKDIIITSQGEQRTILEQQVTGKNSELRKQKRKTRFVAFVGTTVASGLLYLFITKK